MATRKNTDLSSGSERYRALKSMLEERRCKLIDEVQGKIRNARVDGGKERDVYDDGEISEVDIQEDIEFALIQMKTETLDRISEALGRLEKDVYGNCFECGDEIVRARLRALPFAVRCKECEEARENSQIRDRVLTDRRDTTALFQDISH
jgi:DnaK suppressor protein